MCHHLHRETAHNVSFCLNIPYYLGILSTKNVQWCTADGRKQNVCDARDSRLSFTHLLLGFWPLIVIMSLYMEMDDNLSLWQGERGTRSMIGPLTGTEDGVQKRNPIFNDKCSKAVIHKPAMTLRRPNHSNGSLGLEPHRNELWQSCSS